MPAWPPLPPDTGHTPQAVDVLVALVGATAVWGRAKWGVDVWGGWDFDDPTAMECDVQGFSIERGRGDPLAHIQAGKATLTVQDPDREWSPWVIGPNGFRQWRTGVPIQVRTSAGVLFTGVVASIAASEQPQPDALRVVQIDALEPLTFLAASDQLAQGDQGANELAGARLERIWANADIPGWVEHHFDPGVARMQSTQLAQAALTEMWLTADSDAGMLTCTADGVVRYWDTDHGLTADRRVVPQVLFTDDENYSTALPMVCTSKFAVVDDQALVTNWVGVAAKGGTEEVAYDDWSQSFYGPKTTHRNDLIHAEGQPFSKQVAQTMLARLTRQSVVVDPLVFDPLRSPTAWTVAHTLDIGDRVRVHRTGDASQELDITASVDQIKHEITPTGWTTTIQLSPGTQRTAYARWGHALWGRNTWG